MEVEQQKRLRKTIILFSLFSIVYYIWRTFYTLPFGEHWLIFTLGVILLVIELLGGVEFLIHFLNLSNITVPVVGEVDKNDYPHVDVFVATYNEPVELLYKTLVGCLNMDYPDKSKVHIYVLDDGRREAMASLCDELGVTHLTREDNEHAKAGNLNHALSKTRSPYVVTLDADMIPMRDFLMVSMPFFAENEKQVAADEEDEVKKLGFLQLPQVFYNADIFQYQLFSEARIPNEQDYFYRDIELSKNTSNSVIYGGSNTILSREALLEIGGFVTDVITEDIATGMLIQSKGYLSYAIDSIQASGLSAHDLEGILKQRKRWARGCIQTFRRHNPLFTKGLNAKQKLNYCVSIFYWYGSFKRIIYILAPILFAVFNVVLVKANIIQVLLFWLPMYLFTNYTLRQLSNDVRSLKWTNVYETILAPALLPAVIKETFGFSMDKFEVTKKGNRTETSNEGARGLAFFHILFLAFTILGIIKCLTVVLTPSGSSYLFVLFWLVVNGYTLLMSVFFVLGRPVYRESDRFKIEGDLTLSTAKTDYRFKTLDISEQGLSFISDYPYVFEENQTYQMRLSRDRYTAKLLGYFLRVDDLEDGYKYVFKFEVSDEASRRELLMILYDREPNLPTRIEDESIYNDVIGNFIARRQKPRTFARKLPRIEVNLTIPALVGGELIDLTLVNFNYHYAIVEIKEPYDRIEIPLQSHPSVKMHGKHYKSMKRQTEHGEVALEMYEILNYQKLLTSNVFESEIKLWKQ